MSRTSQPSLACKTTVGKIDPEVLSFTAGQDVSLDLALIEADCLGTAAHVVMLSRMPVQPRIVTAAECKAVLRELGALARRARKGGFTISLADQDVHLAIERALTRKLGELGRKVHTARSRNDQVAVDLRLYAKDELLGLMAGAAGLARSLLAFARKRAALPMVGRTHQQPAMPSSVGLWASAHAESLAEDLALLVTAYEINDQCPLGSAAGYGVPLPINRQLVSDLLGFSRPVHNVLYAGNARGKIESIILSAAAQVMLSLSRLAQDLILFSMPEFGWFSLPPEFCTGSSIMPQKRNPDVLELVRAKASVVAGFSFAVAGVVNGLPSGYNRDLQEAKEPFLKGLAVTRSCLRIMAKMVGALKANRQALLSAFTPDVFATDRVLELVREGMPFRDAYHHVKRHLDELRRADPKATAQRKRHLGAPAGLDFGVLLEPIREVEDLVRDEGRRFIRVKARLLGRGAAA